MIDILSNVVPQSHDRGPTMDCPPVLPSLLRGFCMIVLRWWQQDIYHPVISCSCTFDNAYCQSKYASTTGVMLYRSLMTESPLWIVHPPPSFALISCYGLKNLFERAPTQHASIANRDFPLSSKPEGVVRLVYTHYKVQITQPYSGLRQYKVLSP